MAYLEHVKGLPAEPYSREFLDLDLHSGPWLVRSQAESPAMQPNLKRFDVDLEEGVLWLGDDTENRVVALIQVIATYSPEDRKFLWAWANQRFRSMSEMLEQMKQANDDIEELVEPMLEASEVQAWSYAAAAAYKLNAETCYCLPGPVQLFVALFEVTALPEGDPRRRLLQRDPERAAEALAEFAGAAAMAIGGMLIVGLRNHELDPTLQALERFAEKLAALAVSPVGRETPAGEEASELAEQLRECLMPLSFPPEHPEFQDGVRQMLSLLEIVARRYGAWPEEERKDEQEPDISTEETT